MRAYSKGNGAELSATYAAVRNALYEKGYVIEITVNFNPKLHYVAEWWKQLYGESEGKENKGIFPASVDFTTDLHSMGQYIQEGRRNLFETVLSIDKTKYSLQVPCDAHDLDKLNYLAGKRVDEVSKMAELRTQLAHVDGGVLGSTILFLRAGLRHLRRYPRGEHLRPAGRGGLQEQYVHAAR